jgi:PTS system galactitol-specific IIC component
MVIGFILGFAVGLFTRFKTLATIPQQSFLFALEKGLELSIIMILLPRFVNILYKGLTPSVNNIISFINRKVTKRNLYLGMNAIVFAGHPSVIFLSIIIIPFSVYIATILPGNNILPGADLIIIPFILIWAIAPSRGDIFRSFISAIIIVPLTLWIASDMGSLFTSLATKYSIEISETVSNFSSYGGGSNWLFWIILQIIKPIISLFT